LFSPSRKQHNNRESLATDFFERLNFEQSFFKTVFERNSLQNFTKNNLCKVLRRRARDRNRNPSRPRRDLRPSRPRMRLQKTGLETRLETETKSRDSSTDAYYVKISIITGGVVTCYLVTLRVLHFNCNKQIVLRL